MTPNHATGMASGESTTWSDHYVATLRRYDESLVRKVAARLVKPRNQWPVEDLIARCADVIANPATLDRRIAEVLPASRQLLALIAYSRQPRWTLGNAIELMMSLGHEDGLGPVQDLFETGLLYPAMQPLPEGYDGRISRVVSFAHWLSTAGTTGLEFICPLVVATRSLGTDLGLPDLTVEGESSGSFSMAGGATLESDGLEYLLRMGVLWQQVSQSPLRRTQQGGYFKRDTERLGQDALLNSPPPDRIVDVPDLGFLLAELAELEGLLREVDGEIRTGPLPDTWQHGLSNALESIWRNLFRIQRWSPQEGWRDDELRPGNPFPSAFLLVLAILGRHPQDKWIQPSRIESWLQGSHPYWTGESTRPSRLKPWVETFLLGVCFSLKIVQVRKEEESILVRLSPTGRWLLSMGEVPPPTPVFPKTLTVQPNLEMIAFRQGLTPTLIDKLTRLAAWKTIGAACTLQLEPETVYRALETGESFESICQILEQHGTRAIPPAVLDSLRTWASKRDRITIYPSAALLEFNSSADLAEAIARGLPAIRLGDTLAVVPSEDQIDFKQFRLTGTRDYALPPERCVTVEPDGVTLVIDLARSDLMLETELPRFADLVDRTSQAGKRTYRLTPASLNRARQQGWTVVQLETWFQQRTGEPVSAAARLFLVGSQLTPPKLQRHLVLQVEDEEIADGLQQWPETSALIADRLGPTALSIDEANLQALKARLEELSIQLELP